MMQKFTLERINDIETITALHALLEECGKKMQELLGLTHWYPFMDLAKFQFMLEEKELYGVFQHSTPIATFNLSFKPRDYYPENLWSRPKEKAYYLGQFGINPHFQRQGIGKWCMQQIEIISKQAECHAIRFDALNNHPWLKNFYQQLEYRFCGIVKPAEWELACFEKILI
jgi:GNAT superfamily N-acetyltransferase